MWCGGFLGTISIETTANIGSIDVDFFSEVFELWQRVVFGGLAILLNFIYGILWNENASFLFDLFVTSVTQLNLKPPLKEFEHRTPLQTQPNARYLVFTPHRTLGTPSIRKLQFRATRASDDFILWPFLQDFVSAHLISYL